MDTMKAPEMQMALDFGCEETVHVIDQGPSQLEIGTSPASFRKLTLVYSASTQTAAADAKSKEIRVLRNLVAHARALSW